jgi:hypothetical protein
VPTAATRSARSATWSAGPTLDDPDGAAATESCTFSCSCAVAVSSAIAARGSSSSSRLPAQRSLALADVFGLSDIPQLHLTQSGALGPHRNPEGVLIQHGRQAANNNMVLSLRDL